MACQSLVLASGSSSRLAMLRAVGIEPVVMPAAVDEDEIKLSCHAAGMSAAETAETLAGTKAERVAARFPDHYVLGCDQIMALDLDDGKSRWFDKARDRAELAGQLSMIAGRTHVLETAAVLLYRGARIWHHVARPRLSVRALDAGFIARYIDTAGDGLLQCVGGYQIEALGPHLFTRIEGDEFSIRGLPLLPLLGFLRDRGVVYG